MSNPTSSSNRSIFETVQSLRKQLNNAVNNSNVQEIKNILNRLRKEVVPTEELIRTTKIGISVGKQRQSSDPEISKLAKSIVNEWKNGVKKSEPNNNSSSHQSSSSSSKPLNNNNSKPNNPTNSTTQELKSPQSINSSTSTKPTITTKSTTTTTTNSSSASLSKRTVPTSIQQSNSKSSLPSPSSNNNNSNSNNNNNNNNQKKKLNPRSSKTEPSLDFEVLKDKVRDGCMRAVFDALVFDSDAPADLVYERSKTIEEEVYKNNESQSYKNKMRSLIFNLKDKNNPGLREAVVSGELSCKKLCSMGPADMASEERKAQDRKLAEENLFKARGAAPQQAETDGFRCGRCGQRKCTYYQMQTRSADEPMTTFVTCVNCNNRWKFS